MKVGRVSVIFAIIVALGEAVRVQVAGGPQTWTLPTEFWLVVAGACVTAGVQMGQLMWVRAEARDVAEKLENKTEADDLHKRKVDVALAEIRLDLRYLRRRRRDDRTDEGSEGTEA